MEIALLDPREPTVHGARAVLLSSWGGAYHPHGRNTARAAVQRLTADAPGTPRR